MLPRDQELFDLLKEERLKIAREKKCAAFCILHDSTLKLIAQEKPVDLMSLKKIKGIGETKLEEYGNIIIKVVDVFCKNNNIEPIRNKGQVILEKSNFSNKIKLIENIEISKEFEQVLELMENSWENLFITGNAGTGKTSLLKLFKQKTKKKVAILAPTGIAAINIGGQTIHSFFRFPHKYIERKEIVEKWKSKPPAFKKIFRSIETIVIDEASMVRVDIIDGINETLRFIRGGKKGFFGGVQMIFIGDLGQLPPVVDDNELREYLTEERGGEYFFNAKVFELMKQNQTKYFELTKVYRQKDSTFINILNKIRANSISIQEIELLNSRVRSRDIIEESKAIRLTTTNSAADYYNKEGIEKISGDFMNYEALITGTIEEKFYPTEKILHLKVGARIILIKNDPEKRWVNGTLGVITILADNKIQVKLFDGHIVDVPMMTWENIRYDYDKEEKKVKEKVIGTFTQYPIKLAWAITIHKSQGQTFDDAVIDFGEGAFAHGQAYVALSRCRRLEGIILSHPISRSDIIFDNRINDFKKIFKKITFNQTENNCNSCGASIESNFKYCPYCGREKEMSTEDALKNHKKICSDCGQCYDSDEGDESLCNDCLESEFQCCDSCGEVLRETELLVEIKNECLCEKCSEGSKQCACCGEVFWDDELILDNRSGEYYCEDDYYRLNKDSAL